jgi:hypothetical protein
MLHEPENPEYQSSDLCIPPNIYLPPLVGQWRELLVTAVSQDIVEVVRKKFEDCFQSLWRISRGSGIKYTVEIEKLQIYRPRFLSWRMSWAGR